MLLVNALHAIRQIALTTNVTLFSTLDDEGVISQFHEPKLNFDFSISSTGVDLFKHWIQGKDFFYRLFETYP